MLQPPILPIAIIIAIAAVHGELHPGTCWTSQITAVNHSKRRARVCMYHAAMVNSDKNSGLLGTRGPSILKKIKSNKSRKIYTALFLKVLVQSTDVEEAGTLK